MMRKKQHRDYLVVSASWLGQLSKIHGIVMLFGIGVLVENWRNQDSRYCNTKGWDFSLHPSGKNEGWQVFLKPKTNSHKPKTDCSTYGLGNQLVCRIAVQLKSHNCNIILGKSWFGKKTERTSHLFVDVCPLQGSLNCQPRTNPKNHDMNQISHLLDSDTTANREATKVDRHENAAVPISGKFGNSALAFWTKKVDMSKRGGDVNQVAKKRRVVIHQKCTIRRTISATTLPIFIILYPESSRFHPLAPCGRVLGVRGVAGLGENPACGFPPDYVLYVSMFYIPSRTFMYTRIYIWYIMHI